MEGAELERLLNIGLLFEAKGALIYAEKVISRTRCDAMVKRFRLGGMADLWTSRQFCSGQSGSVDHV